MTPRMTSLPRDIPPSSCLSSSARLVSVSLKSRKQGTIDWGGNCHTAVGLCVGPPPLWCLLVRSPAHSLASSTVLGPLHYGPRRPRRAPTRGAAATKSSGRESLFGDKGDHSGAWLWFVNTGWQGAGTGGHMQRNQWNRTTLGSGSKSVDMSTGLTTPPCLLRPQARGARASAIMRSWPLLRDAQARRSSPPS